MSFGDRLGQRQCCKNVTFVVPSTNSQPPGRQERLAVSCEAAFGIDLDNPVSVRWRVHG